MDKIDIQPFMGPIGIFGHPDNCTGYNKDLTEYGECDFLGHNEREQVVCLNFKGEVLKDGQEEITKCDQCKEAWKKAKEEESVMPPNTGPLDYNLKEH